MQLPVWPFFTGELFIAKYEFQPGKQAGLGAHKDGTPWSFVVTLNNPCEFVGGGTRFVEDYAGGVTYRPSTVGSAVIFSGKNKHEGIRICVLVFFCYLYWITIVCSVLIVFV